MTEKQREDGQIHQKQEEEGCLVRRLPLLQIFMFRTKSASVLFVMKLIALVSLPQKCVPLLFPSITWMFSLRECLPLHVSCNRCLSLTVSSMTGPLRWICGFMLYFYVSTHPHSVHYFAQSFTDETFCNLPHPVLNWTLNISWSCRFLLKRKYISCVYSLFIFLLNYRKLDLITWIITSCNRL